MKLMGLTGLLGCLFTYFFISFYNTQNEAQIFSPKKLTYEEVNASTFDRINKLISDEQKSQNSKFANELKLAVQDLTTTKEIYQHTRNEQESIPTYPLVILWGAIAAMGIILLRSKEVNDKSLSRSYEKMLDHLEISYAKDQNSDSSKQNEKVVNSRDKAVSNEV